MLANTAQLAHCLASQILKTTQVTRNANTHRTAHRKTIHPRAALGAAALSLRLLVQTSRAVGAVASLQLVVPHANQTQTTVRMMRDWSKKTWQAVTTRGGAITRLISAELAALTRRHGLYRSIQALSTLVALGCISLAHELSHSTVCTIALTSFAIAATKIASGTAALLSIRLKLPRVAQAT